MHQRSRFGARRRHASSSSSRTWAAAAALRFTRPPSDTRPSSGPGHEFTSQLYFDDALTDRVHALAPYATRGRRTVRNEGDGLFLHGGRQLILGVTERGPGYAGTFDIGLQIAGA